MRFTLSILLAGCTPLPTICVEETREHAVVDKFWGTLDRNYAVFPDRLERDWAEVGLEACDAVSADSSDAGLLAAIWGMATELDDGHVQIETPDGDVDGWEPWPHLAREDDIRAAAEGVFGALQSDDSGAVTWGSEGRIGYLQLSRLDDLARSGSYRGDSSQMSDALDLAMALDVDAFIVDVRFNEGGWDDLGLEVAGRFSSERTLAWESAQRDGAAHTDLGDYESTFVEPAPEFLGPVVLLTSGATFSAGETLVLAMRENPRVTVVGEPTSGHLSDLYDARLPNGWSFTYSGDRYRAADGQVYEGRGIPVDVDVPFDALALDQGSDTVLDAALAWLR